MLKWGGKRKGRIMARLRSVENKSSFIFSLRDLLVVVLRARHNAIVDRLVQALPASCACKPEACPLSSSGLRPDLTVYRDEGRVVLAEVRCTYEAGANTLERSYREKLKKYTDLARSI